MSDAAVSTARKFACQECDKVYSTTGHLRRHAITHSGEKSARCTFCSRSFVKPDVARRHAVSCARKQQADVPPQAKRGRKARACDRCVAKKISCDASLPCSRCTSSGVPCAYSRANGQSGTRGAGGIDGPFLLSYVDSSFESAVTALTAAETCTNQLAADAQGDWRLFSDGESSDFSWGCTGRLFNIWEDIGDGGYSGLDQLPLGHDTSLHLNIRLDEAIHQLAAFQQSSHVLNDMRSEFDHDLAKSIFTAANLSWFSRGYFRFFHPQIPIIHRPTFALETASIPLLIAVFAAGALVSGAAESAQAARRFFTLIEDFIFCQNPFGRYFGLQHDSAPETSHASSEIEVLQAAFIISVIQGSMHNIPTRRRMRVQRHPAFIAVIRAAGLLAWMRRRERCTWEDFVADEVRIRLGVFTILYDSHLSLFFNNPPHISVAEMSVDMPCDEELFEAETGAEFERIQALEQPHDTLSVSKLINLLVRGAQESLPSRLSVVQLQAVIWTLAGYVQTARTGVFASEQLKAIFHATEKWKVLWAGAIERNEAKGIILDGRTKHAAEICWLLQSIIKAAQAGDVDSLYMKRFSRDSLVALDEFIQKYKEL